MSGVRLLLVFLGAGAVVVPVRAVLGPALDWLNVKDSGGDDDGGYGDEDGWLPPEPV